MRRAVAIVGTLLITVTILISSSAVAYWLYIMRVDSSENCTNPNDARYSPDGDHATIGNNEPTLGWIILDLGLGIGMNGSQEFTVFASSTVKETYKIRLLSDPWKVASSWWTGCDDTTDEDFTAPATPPGQIWRYFEIHSEEGDNSDESDPIYGSEIDAIGFDAP